MWSPWETDARAGRKVGHQSITQRVHVGSLGKTTGELCAAANVTSLQSNSKATQGAIQDFGFSRRKKILLVGSSICLWVVPAAHNSWFSVLSGEMASTASAANSGFLEPF